MNIKDIAFMSYAVTDMKRARKFYEGALGLKASSVFEAEGMAVIEDPDGNRIMVHKKK